MNITLRQLKYFVAAAEAGQISQAAMNLSISQSAVTTAIKELELAVGGTLFERAVHGVMLTDSGRRFLNHAYSILAAVEEALDDPIALDTVEDRISVAASYTVLGYFLPFHLKRLAQIYPRLTIDVFEMNREAIEEGLISNRLDLGVLLTLNLSSPDLYSETFVRSERRLWLAARHPLLAKGVIGLDDVEREPFIMLTVDEAAFTAMRYWSQTPYQPNVKLRTSSVEAVRSMVANGSGVAILSDMIYRPWSLEGRRIETAVLKDQIPAMHVGLAWSRYHNLSPGMRVFREYFRRLYLEPQQAHLGAPR